MFTTRNASKRSAEAVASIDQTATPAKRPRSSEAVQVKSEDDADPVLNPQFFPFPGQAIDLTVEDIFGGLSPPPNRVLPNRYLSVLDQRAGKPAVGINISQHVRAERKRQFRQMLLNIVKGLKKLASECRTKWFSEHSGFKLFTNSFGALLFQADLDWLVDCLIAGIPESTMLAFADPEFSIKNLLQLPRLSDGALSEQSVYLDCLEYDPLEDEDYRLYVGSATGQFGCLQRWHSYFKGKCTTRHGKESSAEGRTMNLRCVAHYGLDPEPFLPILAEGVFMVLLGTVDDPGYRSVNTARFVDDELYEAFSTLRKECKLLAPLVGGLNSTWVFTQGWRGRGLRPGTKCVNCPRIVLPRKDPAYRRLDWTYADPIRPLATHVKCINCVTYKKRNDGKERPAELEEKRPGLTPRVKSTHEKPEICEYSGCKEAVFGWCGKHLKWYCVRHRDRALHDFNMDAEPKTQTKPKPAKCSSTIEGKPCPHDAERWNGNVKDWLCKLHDNRQKQGCNMDGEQKSTKPKPTKPKPTKCSSTIEGDPCPHDAEHWNNGVKEWLCKLHETRARQGSNMDAGEKEKPLTPKPAKCTSTIEGAPCKYDAQYWCKSLKVWLCKFHYGRAKSGSDMDAKEKAKQVRAKPPPGPKPTICQWPGCTNAVKCFSGKQGLYLCKTHESRAKAGRDMDGLPAPKK